MLKTVLLIQLSLFVISLRAQQHAQFSSYKDAAGMVHQSYIYVSDRPPVRPTPGYTPPKESYPTYKSSSSAQRSDNAAYDQAPLAPVPQNGYGTYTYPNGTTYTGYFVNGQREGKGVLTRYDRPHDTIYAGEWKRDLYDGKGTYIFEGRYTGEFKKGDYNGFGILTYRGDRYEGNFENDARDGSGTMYYGNGDKYEGWWSGGKKNYKGTFTWANGEKYVGEFFRDQMNGAGKLYDRSGWLLKEGNWDAGVYVSALPLHRMPNGDKYYGELKNDKYDGYGLCTYPDGSKYNGHFADGMIDGKGRMETAAGLIYDGDWVKGKKHGQGAQIYPDQTFVGSFVNDSITGYGTVKYNAGGELSGYFKNGLSSGPGTYVDASGNKWVGEWKDDALDGKVAFTGVDGATYNGEYKNGKAWGKGVSTFPDGTRMEGDFVKGKMEGQGILTTKRGERYEGSWLAGMPNGHGSYIDYEGGRYEGEYVNNLKEGQGVYVSPNGSKYSGHWKNDKRDGFGTSYTRSGEVEHKGVWKNDLFTNEESRTVKSLKTVIESASNNFPGVLGTVHQVYKGGKSYETSLAIVVEEPLQIRTDGIIFVEKSGSVFQQGIYFKNRDDRTQFLQELGPVIPTNGASYSSEIKLPDNPGITLQIDTSGKADLDIRVKCEKSKK